MRLISHLNGTLTLTLRRMANVPRRTAVSRSGPPFTFAGACTEPPRPPPRQKLTVQRSEGWGDAVPASHTQGTAKTLNPQPWEGRASARPRGRTVTPLRSVLADLTVQSLHGGRSRAGVPASAGSRQRPSGPRCPFFLEKRGHGNGAEAPEPLPPEGGTPAEGQAFLQPV